MWFIVSENLDFSNTKRNQWKCIHFNSVLNSIRWNVHLGWANDGHSKQLTRPRCADRIWCDGHSIRNKLSIRLPHQLNCANHRNLANNLTRIVELANVQQLQHNGLRCWNNNNGTVLSANNQSTLLWQINACGQFYRWFIWCIQLI